MRPVALIGGWLYLNEVLVCNNGIEMEPVSAIPVLQVYTPGQGGGRTLLGARLAIAVIMVLVPPAARMVQSFAHAQ